MTREDQIAYEWIERVCDDDVLSADVEREGRAILATLREAPETQEPETGWRDIATAPKDRLILGALVVNDVVWRVHEMRHNGLAFYTKAGGALPAMTHWTELPPLATPGGTTP